jgi:hypothetical protein
MSAGLEFKYLWHDVDVFEVAILASNGEFAGAAKTYIQVGGLSGAAQTLDGFPRNLSDARELSFGSFGREFAGGGVHLRFFCGDGAGHAVAEIRIESEDARATGSRWRRPEQTAHLFAEFEAHAMDEFVAELRQMEETMSGCAALRLRAPGL